VQLPSFQRVDGSPEDQIRLSKGVIASFVIPRELWTGQNRKATMTVAFAVPAPMDGG
jgi:hypothetical protein